jgi:hypothetical protein
MDPRFFRKYLDQLSEDGIPVITGDPNAPQTQPHPAAQGLTALRVLKNLSNIRSNDIEAGAQQELSNVLRSGDDASSKNVSFIDRFFGRKP